MRYLRPLLQRGYDRPDDSVHFSDRNFWFTHCNVYARDRGVYRIPVQELSRDELMRLTQPRGDIQGLVFNKPIIMGILNATPDSFSDGGQFDALEAAERHGEVMQNSGADLIDIGGESTRPGADYVDVDDEIARTAPKIEKLASVLTVPMSIDTRKAAVARAAIDAGASCATHLMNAMPPLINRDPGPVVAIMNAGLACGIICDGIHVQDEMIKLALRAHAHPDRIFLVSDSMPTIGGPDQFDLYDMTVRLTEGQLINSEGSLAGAHITQAEGVARLVNAIGLDVVDALHMAIDAPANVMRRSDLKNVDGRSISDLVILSNCAQHTTMLHAILEKEWAGEPAQ